MLRTLVLALICSNSPAKGLIFSFVPGGNAIRNLFITPLLNRLNTTFSNEIPTPGANAVRVIDPILAMQFAQDDLVSSPEDYRKSAYPYYPPSRNSPESDQVGGPGPGPGPRHLGMFPYGTDYSHPQLPYLPPLPPLPAPPRDRFEFMPYDYHGDGLFPLDYYLNDYLYAANQYPVGGINHPQQDLLARHNDGSNQQPGDILSMKKPITAAKIRPSSQSAFLTRYAPFVRDYVASSFSSNVATQPKTSEYLQDQLLPLETYPVTSNYIEPKQVYSDRLSDPSSRAENTEIEGDLLRHWLGGSNPRKYARPLEVENNLFNQYEPRYGPFPASILESNVLLQEDNLSNRLEDALSRVPSETKSRVPFKIPSYGGTNNINYGIVEPNFGNYPIYSFDNTNPIQNFNHQTNPSFNSIEPLPSVPNKSPSFWPLAQKTENSESPVAPENTPKELFTPNDLFESGKYSEEEIQKLQALSKNSLACPPKAPTNPGYNEDGIRRDWPADPKSQSRDATDEPQKIDLSAESKNPIPAFVVIPKSDQSPEDSEDSALNTIASNRTYNFVPIQLPESFLKTLISNGLFSMLHNNAPSGDGAEDGDGDGDGDTITTATNPRSYSLLNAKKHNIQLYDPRLRGYYGTINPFAQHHKGIGYGRPRIR